MSEHDHHHDHDHTHQGTQATAPIPSALAKVGAVIAVASGKGGVGKSTVAVNLACALSEQGYRVGLLDADIYGPSQHIMMGLRDRTPSITEDKKIIPIEQHGIRTLSFGFFVKADEAVIWRGPMIARMFQQFINDVIWGELDYLIIDLPPGTGDIQLTLSQTLNVTGVVIVTTPQDVALADAIKGIHMFRKVNVEILGIVENMSYHVCSQCNHHSYIFSHGGGKKQSEKLKVPFLGEIPLDESMRLCSDEGVPIVISQSKSPQTEAFLEMAAKVHQQSEEIKKKAPQKPAPSFDNKFSV